MNRLVSVFRVTVENVTLLETLRKDEAVEYAQSVCRDTKGATIPDVTEIRRFPVDHRSA